MEEIWKDVVGYEGYYQVSNLGRVRSLGRKQKSDKSVRQLKGRIISPSLSTSGYWMIHFCVNNKKQTISAHKLVTRAFLGEKPDGCDIDHIDENKLNNNVLNLRYISIKENRSRSSYKLRRHDMKMEKNTNAKRVIETNGGVTVKIWGCAKEISKTFCINYSTLKKYLQKDKCIINGNEFRYIA